MVSSLLDCGLNLGPPALVRKVNLKRSRPVQQSPVGTRPLKKVKRVHVKVDSRMAKNRASAHKSRIKKQKERCTLEAQVRMLSSQNRALTKTIGALTPQCEERLHLQTQNSELMKELFELKLQNQQLQTELMLRGRTSQGPKINVTNVHHNDSFIVNSSPMVTSECQGARAQDSAVVTSQQSETAIRTAMAEFAMKAIVWQLWMRSLQVHGLKTRTTGSEKTSSSKNWNPLFTLSARPTQCTFSKTWEQSPRQSTSLRQLNSRKSRRGAQSVLRHLPRLSHAESSQLLVAGQLLHVAIYVLYAKWRSRPGHVSKC